MHDPRGLGSRQRFPACCMPTQPGVVAAARSGTEPMPLSRGTLSCRVLWPAQTPWPPRRSPLEPHLRGDPTPMHAAYLRTRLLFTGMNFCRACSHACCCVMHGWKGLAAEKSRVRAHNPQASRERSVVCDWRKWWVNGALNWLLGCIYMLNFWPLINHKNTAHRVNKDLRCRRARGNKKVADWVVLHRPQWSCTFSLQQKVPVDQCSNKMPVDFRYNNQLISDKTSWSKTCSIVESIAWLHPFTWVHSDRLHIIPDWLDLNFTWRCVRASLALFASLISH
jgi:hypothetical protein